MQMWAIAVEIVASILLGRHDEKRKRERECVCVMVDG